MNIKTVVVGDLKTNCYIIENDKDCLIIDPGDEFKKINCSISKNVVGIFLTHKHFDHYGALKDFCEFYDVDIYSFNNLKEGKLSIGSFNFEVKFNPGHTMDSISFIFNDIMFSGDFVFNGTIGRCDIGGNFDVMKESIRKLLQSNINYKIYPGHGEITTLNNERKMLNFYLK